MVNCYLRFGAPKGNSESEIVLAKQVGKGSFDDNEAVKIETFVENGNYASI